MSSNNTSKIRSILIRGFGLITLLIAAMTGVWFFMIMDNQRQIESIMREQNETRAIFTMRDAAYQRAIILHRMALLEDEFDRDEENLKLKEKAEEFIKAREAFLSAEDAQSNSKGIQLWEKALPDIRKGSRIQSKAAELLLNDETKQANQLLLNEVIPTQTLVMSQLTDLLDTQRHTTESEVNTIFKQNRSGLIFIGIIAGIVIFWGFGVALYTIRRTARIEQSLEEARLKATNADHQKSRFLANMSHEIRTPLTAIIGYSETLIEDKQNISDWKQYVGSIIKNGKHLHHLINDILDLSKIEANQLSIEVIPVTVCELISEIESLVGERAKKKGVDFILKYQLPIPKVINSDPTRLKQILINLCGNAIKFTAEGSITLQTHFDKSNNHIVFTIEDTGIGMTQEQIAELFKPFQQADTSTARKFGGTGLGLYISKQLTERLNGNLTLESQPKIGSKFIVSIETITDADTQWITSMEEITSVSHSNQLEAVTPTLNGKILLAEDNPDNQAIIAMHIRKTGAEVTIVENGQQAIDKALSEHFDLILMDMQMPIMGGIEATKALRDKHCRVPIATLTANAMQEDILESEQAGAEDFLTKPIDRKLFYSVLTRNLPAASASQTLPNAPTAEPKHELDDISDLIDMYIGQLPETCYRIQRFVNAREWEEVKNEIHQLKGTGGAFGLPEITEQCIDIEKQIITNEYDLAHQLINQLENTCTNIFSKHIPQAPSA